MTRAAKKIVGVFFNDQDNIADVVFDRGRPVQYIISDETKHKLDNDADLETVYEGKLIK